MNAIVRRENGRVWLNGLAVEGCDSVVAAVTTLLRVAGEDVKYPYLMGVSGAAFRL